MRVPLFKRVIITFCNILFPPLAVALLTGWTSHETFLNSLLFLLAVIPSHIHGFYVSIVYFTRKRRVRQGKWPGKPYKAGIRSEKVLTGGAGWKGAEALKPLSRKERNRQSARSRSQSATRNRYTTEVTPQLSRSSSRPISQSNTIQGTNTPYTDAQMTEAMNMQRVGSQISRTSRRF